MIETPPQPPTLPTEPPPVVRPKPPRPSPIRTIAIYFFFIFIGAALIAPRLHASAQFLAQEISPRFYWLATQPFHRYVNRCLLILALIALPSFFKALGVRSIKDLGLPFTARRCVESLQGFIWGFVTLAVATALLAGSDIRVFDFEHSPASWKNHFKNAALAALVVAVIEELIFRGAIFGALRRSHRFWAAAILSSALYALLHFFEKPENPRYIEWNSGLYVLADMLRGFTNWNTLIPAFLNLTLVGLLLARAFDRTGSLYFSIGLHAGLVFWLKSFGFLTNPKLPNASSFWGTDKLVDGWITTLVLGLLFLLIDRSSLAHQKPIEP